MASRIIIITGKKDSGKTSTLKRIIREQKSLGKTVGGIISEARGKGSDRVSYYAVDILTGEKMLLATTEKIETNITFGRFFFSEKGIKFARNTLKKTEGSDIVVIDELGPLECMEEGFLDEALDLVKQYDGELILVIREECLNTIIEKLRPALDEDRVKIITPDSVRKC